MLTGISVRDAEREDCADIATIYNEGIDDRIATFETVHRSEMDISGWIDGTHPTVVALYEGHVAGFATSSPYSSRECYSGVAEFSVYVKREFRGNGLGISLMNGLIERCARKGIWKLVSRIFVENAVSRRLMQKAGFREVGIYRKHARLDGKWRDVVIVECLL